MTHKSRKIKKFHVLKCCSLLRAEGFFCNLDGLFGGLGFFSIFGHQSTWIRIGIQPQMNTDPHPRLNRG